MKHKCYPKCKDYDWIVISCQECSIRSKTGTTICSFTKVVRSSCRRYFPPTKILKEWWCAFKHFFNEKTWQDNSYQALAARQFKWIWNQVSMMKVKEIKRSVSGDDTFLKMTLVKKVKWKKVVHGWCSLISF